MQDDRLRDFLKFFRFNLPWFIVSAGFFAVILLASIFISSKLNLKQKITESPSPQVAAIIPNDESIRLAEPEAPLAPIAPVATIEPATPSPVPTPKATIKPLPTVTPTVRPIAASTPAPTPTMKPSDDQSATTYTVKSGDTLWSIAVEQYGSGYDYQRILKENKLVNAGQIEVGQTLQIPAKPGEIASGVSIDLGDTQSSDSTSYTIQKGDSLWKIAEEQLGNPYRWTEIYEVNKKTIGANPNLIYAQTKLVLPKKLSDGAVPKEATTNSDPNASESSSLDSQFNWTSALLQ